MTKDEAEQGKLRLQKYDNLAYKGENLSTAIASLKDLRKNTLTYAGRCRIQIGPAHSNPAPNVSIEAVDAILAVLEKKLKETEKEREDL